MGKYKLLMKSIVFSTRSRRRFFTFVIVFSILSGMTILLLYYFDGFSREGLLRHRGVVIKADGMESIQLNQAQSDIQVTDGALVDGSEATIFYKYINFGANLRIFSISSKYPWAFHEIRPRDLVKGGFPNSDNEVLISNEASLTLDDVQSNLNIYTEPVVGTILKIGVSEALALEFKVSGIFKKPVPSNVNNDNREWLLITESAFDSLVDDLNPAPVVYVHAVTIIASGDVFSGAAYTNVDAIADVMDVRLSSTDFITEGGYTLKNEKDEQRSMAFLFLIFGLLGTFMVSTLYSYLITRFRRREVAVLKAMGYSKWDVRIVVLSEILVVAVTGFIIGIIAIQLAIWNPMARTSAYYYPILISSTSFLSFLAVVLSSVPGFFIISFRILSVRPIEIFKQK